VLCVGIELGRCETGRALQFFASVEDALAPDCCPTALILIILNIFVKQTRCISFKPLPAANTRGSRKLDTFNTEIVAGSKVVNFLLGLGDLGHAGANFPRCQAIPGD
jgi:hypothetical protein